MTIMYERYFLKKPFENAGRVFIFLDEIQYAGDWSSIIKRFYDLYPNLKFYISGSSSFLLSKAALDKLTGRFFALELRPLTFLEFLEMKGVSLERIESSSRRMEIYFNDYLRKAVFPEIVSWENKHRIREYVRNSVVDRVILRDLPLIFRTRDMILMERIVKFILSNLGVIINLNSLSRNLGKSRITISNYLKFLELSLLIRSLSNFKLNFLSSSRKLKKYYPRTTSLIFSFSKEVFEENFGKVLESYVVNALDTEYYFRRGS